MEIYRIRHKGYGGFFVAHWPIVEWASPELAKEAFNSYNLRGTTWDTQTDWEIAKYRIVDLGVVP